MDASIVLNLLVPVLIAVAVASPGFVVDDAYVERWASSAGLALTDENRPEVRRYLTWSRRSRTVGGLLGFLGPLIVAAFARSAFGTDVSAWDPGALSSLLVFLGYLVGALVAELAINRPAGRPGEAVPGSRRPADFLPGYLLVIQRGLGVLCLVLVAAYAITAPLTDVVNALDVGTAAVFGLAGAGVAAVIEGLQRLVIGRRQLIAGPDDLPVDDAKRSTAAHILAGSGIALLLFFVAGLLSAFLTLVSSPSAAIGLLPIALLFPASIFFWLDSGRPHGFRVRRREHLGATS